MRFLRPLLGLALLAGLLNLIDAPALLGYFRQADILLFGAALLAATLANLLCAKRWRDIAQYLGLKPIPHWRFVSAYAQGISINSVVPGGIVGGDAWRSLLISKDASRYMGSSERSEGHRAVLSVLLDRVSGFWGLTWLSLFAMAIAFISSHVIEGEPLPNWFNNPLWLAYFAVLVCIALAPMAGQLFYVVVLKHAKPVRASRLMESLIQVANSLPILWKTLLLSITIQAITVLAFWLCLASVSISAPWSLVMAASGGIFLSGMLPASLGGFGARELGALAFLAPFGFAHEGVLAGSILFGLTATLQGFVGLWFWITDRRRDGS